MDIFCLGVGSLLTIYEVWTKLSESLVGLGHILSIFRAKKVEYLISLDQSHKAKFAMWHGLAL